MLDREACERRVFRLAILLLGEESRAVKVVESVIGAQPDLTRLDSAHLDRLTILRSREFPASPLPSSDIPGEIGAGLGALPRQQREAWVLHYVFRMMPRDMARAMDCSVRAIGRHVVAAEFLMADHIGTTHASAGKLLLSYSMKLDMPPIARRRLLHRRRWRTLLRIAYALLVVAFVGGAIYALYATGRFDLSMPTAQPPSNGADDPPQPPSQ